MDDEDSGSPPALAFPNDDDSSASLFQGDDNSSDPHS